MREGLPMDMGFPERVGASELLQCLVIRARWQWKVLTLLQYCTAGT